MQHAIRLDDPEHGPAINHEIELIREALGRSSKLRDLFDYLVERSRNGAPPREIEIAQDVFGRAGGSVDDGGARVYIHRLRRRLEEFYGDRRDAALRIALPLGEYRLVAEPVGEAPATVPDAAPLVMQRKRAGWWPLALSAAAGALVAFAIGYALLPLPAAMTADVQAARRSAIWAPLLTNGKPLVVAEGDHYLFADRTSSSPRLIRDYAIRSREDLDGYLLAHPREAERFADAGMSYVPTTVPRAQAYLTPVLLAAPSIRVLPASQLPAAAMLSQNIVYLGLVSGLGPLRAPVGSGSRFELPGNADLIHDRSTNRNYGAGRADPSVPRRQYGVVSLFAGKEGNRYIVMAGTSEMGLVGLVETLADPQRLAELKRAVGDHQAAEALYQVDSQGAGVLAVQLLAIHARDQRAVWAP